MWAALKLVAVIANSAVQQTIITMFPIWLVRACGSAFLNWGADA